MPQVQGARVTQGTLRLGGGMNGEPRLAGPILHLEPQADGAFADRLRGGLSKKALNLPDI